MSPGRVRAADTVLSGEVDLYEEDGRLNPRYVRRLEVNVAGGTPGPSTTQSKADIFVQEVL